jgi:catechol 2,3-dioxygenase-like lactoylglutathione lyase family enzyme
VTIVLDHTIVPARDKHASSTFFAEMFGLEPPSTMGPFAAVRVNDALTRDISDSDDVRALHYAFHVSDAEIDAIFGRVVAAGIGYGSSPFALDDMNVGRRGRGRGVYFRDPDGHVLEILTRT